MALNRKYSALPDLDTAPDIYETPELIDDNSTVLTTTGRSPSDNESEADDDGDAGISRSHVQVDEARLRFRGSSVDARDVDFSDRVDGKRQAYRTATRRRRRRRRQGHDLGEGPRELGDLSDEEDGDDEDNLERKIARLQREVEEAKEAYGKQKAQAAAAAGAAATPSGPVSAESLDALSQALDALARLTHEDTARGAARLPLPPPQTAAAAADAAEDQIAVVAANTAPPQPSPATSHALAQVADFDRRLVLLERAIGVNSSVLPELDGSGTSGGSGGGGGTGLPRAILPTLDSLHRQIGTLAGASTASLDGISRRVRTLTQEADQLTKARAAAAAAQDALAQASGQQQQVLRAAGVVSGGGGGGGGNNKSNNNDNVGGDDDDNQTAKINALYGTLPTIESLTPLLPPLLDRLRSLRAIHADAAAASALLDDLGQRQADTAAEVKQWREGLATMEAALRDGEATMGKNMQVMEGWVKDLETRLAKTADSV